MKPTKKVFASVVTSLSLVLLVLIISSCSTYRINRHYNAGINLSTYIKPGEPIAIMPFETENALSNLGGLVSDEITTNLLQNVKGVKIIPTTITRGLLQSMNIPVNGIPDYHTIHSLGKGLKCRYLLTGNFYSSVGDVRYTNSYSSRIATGSITVRLIDCDSATVIWAKRIDDSFQTTSYYTANSTISTNYLTDGQLMQELIRKLGADVAEYFYSEE